MNWVDLAALAVLALSSLVAFGRGLVREVLGIGAWLGASVAAVAAFGAVSPLARSGIADQTVADAAALGGVFLVVLLALWLLARRVSDAVQRSAAGSLDRTLGLVFGAARGAALLVVAYILAGLVIGADQWPAPVREARSLPIIYQGAIWAADQLPPDYRPAVAPLPASRTATAAALMRATPVGRALGPRAQGSGAQGPGPSRE